jgi:MoaA/NifB/PqqE/SkfB family radical SAM enzyme
MKIFHFKDKLDSLPRESAAILPPINIRIKPTNICNHNCWYCAYRVDSLQLGQDMDPQDSIPRDKMLEMVADFGEMGVRAVTFSGGGDPFCYPYLLETVEGLASHGIRFASLTNGSRLQGPVADFFADHGTWLRISMDGWSDESYAAARGCETGEFSRILDNMMSFKKRGGPCYLGVNIVVDNRNCHHLYELISRLHDLGIDSVKASPCMVSNRGDENTHYHQSHVETVKEQLSRARAILGGNDFEIFDGFATELHSFAKEYHWCPYLQIAPVIGADLNVYSCPDKAYNCKDGLLGSLSGMRFKELWNESKERFFALDPARVCQHHCLADARNRQIIEYLDADVDHLVFV